MYVSKVRLTPYSHPKPCSTHRFTVIAFGVAAHAALGHAAVTTLDKAPRRADPSCSGRRRRRAAGGRREGKGGVPDQGRSSPVQDVAFVVPERATGAALGGGDAPVHAGVGLQHFVVQDGGPRCVDSVGVQRNVAKALGRLVGPGPLTLWTYKKTVGWLVGWLVVGADVAMGQDGSGSASR